MNKIEFLNFLNHPESITEGDLSKLEALAEQYPYSQVIHILVAKGRHNMGLETFRVGLHRAALSANNRDLLKKLIEDVKVSNIIPPLEAEVAPPTEKALSSEALEETITSTEEAISEPAAEQEALAPEAKAPQEESVDEEITTNTEAEDSKQEALLSEADQPNTLAEIEPDVTQNDPVKEEFETSEKLSLATDNQDVPDENGIHSELMANLKKLRQQREKLDEEKEEVAASEDPIKETTDDSPVSTNDDTEAIQIDSGDKPVESEALFYDPPMEELTEASFIADKEESLPDKVEESVESSITEEQKSQMEIIDSFIKNSPVLSKPNLSADSEATSQTDLSIKSAKFHQDFASENLATILVKQGKRKDAVGIYKKLMVKFPKKKAYFADQIESLNTK